MYWSAFFVVTGVGLTVGCYFLYRPPRSLHSDLAKRHSGEQEVSDGGLQEGAGRCWGGGRA
jgi:hypothetical protein